MSVLPIIFAPNPIFSRPANIVSTFDAALKQQIQNMLDTLYDHRALGLGSNMLGIHEAIIVIDLDHAHPNPYVMVNPRILSYGEQRVKQTEASLSFPSIRLQVERPESIKVSYVDALGKSHQCEADGLLARVIQHEIDYLNGRTFLDHVGPLKRKWAMQKLYKKK
jgi:peptide deformylase